MTTKTRTKGTKETNRTKKMNGTKGKGKEEKQLLRKMRPKPMRTKRKTLLGRGPKDDKLGGALSELLEFLFELNIMFITDEFTNGQTLFQSPGLFWWHSGLLSGCKVISARKAGHPLPFRAYL